MVRIRMRTRMRRMDCKDSVETPIIKRNSQNNQNIESALNRRKIKYDRFPIELDPEENSASTSAFSRSQSQDSPPLSPSNPTVLSFSLNLPPVSSSIPHSSSSSAVSSYPLHPLHTLSPPLPYFLLYSRYFKSQFFGFMFSFFLFFLFFQLIRFPIRLQNKRQIPRPSTGSKA